MDTDASDPTARGSGEPDPLRREETVITSVYGHIVKLPMSVEPPHQVPSTTSINEFRDSYGMDTCGVMDSSSLKRAWLMFSFTATDQARPLFTYLANSCDLVAIGISGVNDEHSALCHRKTHQVLDLGAYGASSFSGPSLRERKNATDISYLFVEAWLRAQRTTITNFRLTIVQGYDEETIMTEWEGRTKYEIHADILVAKNVKKARRTEREAFVADNNVQLMAMWSALGDATPAVLVKVLDSDHLDIKAFSIPASEMMLSFVKIVDGSIGQFSAKDWILEAHMRYTAVIHGPPQLGKTPLAKSLAATVAPIYAEYQTGELKFLLVSTVDVIPRNMLKEGMPLVLDEFNPNARRGSRPAHNGEDIKIITDVNGGTLNGRGGSQGGDIHFPPRMARIITNNASNPKQFFNILPEDLFDGMNDADRLGLCNEAKAVLKRCAFLHVKESIIRADTAAQQKEMAARAVTARDTALYSGINSIP